VFDNLGNKEIRNKEMKPKEIVPKETAEGNYTEESLMRLKVPELMKLCRKLGAKFKGNAS
jgi:hypothetical protein